MLFPSHSITPCGEINFLAPCGGSSSLATSKMKQVCKAFLPSHNINPMESHSPTIHKKSDGYAVAFNRCRIAAHQNYSLFTAPNIRFRALKKNREDFTISHLIKRRGRLWGNRRFLPHQSEAAASGNPPAGVRRKPVCGHGPWGVWGK